MDGRGGLYHAPAAGFGVAENAVTQVVAIIMAGADVVAYIIAEGLVDANSTAE